MDANEFLTYWRVIRKRWWLILLPFVVTIGVIIATQLTATPLYRSTTRLQVVAAAPGEVALFGQLRATATRDEIVQAQADFIQTLYSDAVAFQTISAAGLAMSPPELKANVSNSTDGAFINVTYAATSQDIAQQVLTTLVEETLKTYRRLQARPANVISVFLTGELAKAEQIVKTESQNLLTFKQRYNVEDFNREVITSQDALRTLRTQRDTIQTQSLQAQRLVTFYTDLANDANRQAEDAISRNATATASFWQAQARTYGERLIEQQALGESSQIALTQLDQQIATRERELGRNIGLLAEQQLLNEKIQRAAGYRNFLYDKQNEAMLKENQALESGFIEVTDPPRTSDRAIRANSTRLLVAGALGSLIAGVVLAFLLEFVETLMRHTAANASSMPQ